MSQIVAIETAAMERQERQETKPQDRYAGRLKFTGCRQCMSPDGWRSATREQMARFFLPGAIERSAPWYRDPGIDSVLYYPCWACNWKGARDAPDDLEPLSVANVLDWLDNDADSMSSDYDALAAEEPVLASEDSRDSAGM